MRSAATPLFFLLVDCHSFANVLSFDIEHLGKNPSWKRVLFFEYSTVFYQSFHGNQKALALGLCSESAVCDD